MSKSKYFYVYAVVNFEQRLAYIGSRGSLRNPIKDPYMGSYDKNSGFNPNKKIILSEHATRAEAYEAEREWQIKFDVAASPLFVNKGIHTSSGFSMYGRKLEGAHKLKSINHLLKEVEKQCIPVKLKNIHTNEVREFKSISEAARELKLSQPQLGFVVKGECLKTGDWCLAKTSLEVFNKSFSLKNSKTGEVKEFKSHDEAAEYIGVSRRLIQKVLNGKQVSTNGFTLPQTDDSRVVLHTKSVRLMNAFTKEIKEFKTLSDAAAYLEVQTVNISMVLSKKRVCTKGYVLAPKNCEDYKDLEERLSQARKLVRQPKALKILDKTTNKIHLFESQSEAAKFLGCSGPLVSQLFLGKIKSIFKRYVAATDEGSSDSG